MAKRSKIKKQREKTDEPKSVSTFDSTSKEEGSAEPKAVSETPFEQVVKESQAKIAEESASTSVPRRGRGRPRKIQSDEAPKVAAAESPVVASPISPPPDISKILTTPLQALSKIPAKNYGVADLALTQEEAAACAESLNQVLQAFVPDQNAMSPKTAAVVMAFLTFGSIGFSKYMILLDAEEAREKLEPKKPEPEIQDAIKQEQERAKIDAADYYKRAPLNA